MIFIGLIFFLAIIFESLCISSNILLAVNSITCYAVLIFCSFCQNCFFFSFCLDLSFSFFSYASFFQRFFFIHLVFERTSSCLIEIVFHLLRSINLPKKSKMIFDFRTKVCFSWSSQSILLTLTWQKVHLFQNFDSPRNVFEIFTSDFITAFNQVIT